MRYVSVADCGASGDTQAINKSLSALGDVFSAIAKRQAHVPYRNSTLTRLLQACLIPKPKPKPNLNLNQLTTCMPERS